MLLFFILLFSASVYAEDGFLYISGEAFGDPSSSSVREEAYQNALRSLVLEHFGASVTVEDGNLDKVNYGRVFIDSPSVNIKGLVVYKTEEKENKVVVTLRAGRKDLEAAKVQVSSNTEVLIKESKDVGELRLVVTPEDSSIFVNGIPFKQSEKIYLPIGLKHKVAVKHRDYLTEELEVVLSEKTGLTKQVDLKPIPSKVLISLTPAYAALYIDNELQLPGKTEFYLDAGDHEISAEKNGYFDKKITINIRPNSKKIKEVEISLKVRTLKKNELGIDYHPLWAAVGYQLINPLNIGVSIRTDDMELSFHGSLISSDWGSHNNRYKLHNSVNSIEDYYFGARKYFLQSNKNQLGFGGVLGGMKISKNNDSERKESIGTWYTGGALLWKTKLTNEIHLHLEGGVIWGDFKENNFSEKASVGIGWSY